MKIKLFLLCLPVFLICLSVQLFGQDRLVDNAELLSPGEAQTLREMLDRVSHAYDFDLVIVTEKDIGKNRPMYYADDFFDYNGYGLGEDFDGILFLQVTGSRDYWFSTSGRGIDIYNKAAFAKLEKNVLKYLSKGNNYEAYLTFVNRSEEFLKLDANGKRYNYFRYYFPIFIISSWVLAFLIGLIKVAAWKWGMNNALLKTEAASYIVTNTLTIEEKKDRFIYSTVSKTARAQNSSSGGGSSSHTSSSGRSHGGSGGRY